MNVTVFGGAGYLGGAVSARLLEDGHQVTVFDNLSFGEAAVRPLQGRPGFSLTVGDMRDLDRVAEAVRGRQAVILLAALVGEPACDRNPAETLTINYLATTAVMKAALVFGVERLLFASTDSCYGAQENVFLTEDSPLKPISLYAELKARVEEEFLAAPRSDSFVPTVLRLATLYGLAPRMRFDLVINLLAREAAAGAGAKIFSGEQWRPLVHVRDAARAFALALAAPPEKVRGRVFNVGSNEQNVQFRDLAKILLSVLPEARVETVPQPPDLRDYHVCFDRIRNELGFTPTLTPAEGLAEIAAALRDGRLGDPYDPIYRNS